MPVRVVSYLGETPFIFKMVKYLIMFQGKELGQIEANDYEEARARIEEVITIEEELNGGFCKSINMEDKKDITNKSVYKVSCEYYLYADSEEEAIEFIANEDNIVDSHFIIEEVNKSEVDEDDIYNHTKYNKDD